MTDSTAEIFKAVPQRLANLMDLDEDTAPIWRPEEFRAILQHQLSVPIQFDLGNLDPGLAAKLKTLSEAEGLLVKSFGDLFHHACPPIELLRSTKDFAKANREHPNSPLPREIASLLYYLTIAVALARCGERITQLGDEDLRRGFDWAMTQSWVDEKTKSLIGEALKLLAASSP